MEVPLLETAGLVSTFGVDVSALNAFELTRLEGRLESIERN